ncbi:MAG TPA: phosphoenolpyruvate--protein phosphotransferase [Gammaproteobacteria bacterium]|nr:phosphoenolpyruvate--protein phosphotransferase [Gammaproteobacteria bacterium]
MLENLRRIVQEVNAAPDLDQALQIIVKRVRESIGVDVASVYLKDVDRGQYVLSATEGLRKDAVGNVRFNLHEGIVGVVGEREEPVNLEDASTHSRYRFTSETGEQRFHGFLGVPIIQYGKVLGVLVIRQKQLRRFGDEEEAFLVTLAAQLAGAITHAGASGQVANALQTPEAVTTAIQGIPGSPGVAIGQAMVVYPPANLDVIPDRIVTDTAYEEQVFMAAVSSVQEDLRDYANRMSPVLPAEELALFDAWLLMLGGDSLVGETVERIRAGNWAQGALRETIGQHVRVFEAMEDSYLRERASDIRDLGRRILTHLQSDRPSEGVFYPQTVLVGEDISAGQLAGLPLENLAGIVSASGSSSSHVAILAQALGIPAVMGARDIPVGRLEGRMVIADGYRGSIYINPSALVRKEFERLRSQESELTEKLREISSQPSVTPDGVSIPLYLNIGLVSGVETELHSDGDGVGLYRTEIPFLIRENFPGEEEQMRIYRKALEAFAPRPVTLRTLDVGGDKMLSYFPVQEENPFLGWRGIRISLDHPEIFLTQMRAMLRASAGLNNLTVMLPMISTVTELDIALTLINQAQGELIEEGEKVLRPPIGIMIEVPSAVYQTGAMAKRVDFFSIGTNDLTQYLLAVDRNNSRVASLYQSLHPAVLCAVRQVVREAHQLGKPVSVCGEMAGDPASVLALLGLDVDSLSMSVSNLARVKWVIRSFSRAEARDLLEQALRLEEPRAIREMYNNVLEQGGLGGLIRAGN